MPKRVRVLADDRQWVADWVEDYDGLHMEGDTLVMDDPATLRRAAEDALVAGGRASSIYLNQLAGLAE